MNAKIPMRKYAYRLIIFSIIIAAISLSMQLILPQYSSTAMPYIVIFFFFITLLSLYIVLRDEQKRDSKKFVSGYLLSRIIKFTSCLLFLTIYLFANPTDRWLFAGAFMVIYFLFSGYEIYALKKEK
ncbi:MAG: hypothetical protein LBV46_02995 [Bacteroidales bacterium]|jgi:L-asparagine transporter-like permease|nr:hypothetical protein [Bacteroidales bacterium]